MAFRLKSPQISLISLCGAPAGAAATSSRPRSRILMKLVAPPWLGGACTANRVRLRVMTLAWLVSTKLTMKGWRKPLKLTRPPTTGGAAGASAGAKAMRAAAMPSARPPLYCAPAGMMRAGWPGGLRKSWMLGAPAPPAG
ncbi:hypothetical protein D3C72_1394610 [compost metagenome]